MTEKQDLADDIQDKITFYQKNKQAILTTVVFVVGLFGGNTDRIMSYVSSMMPQDQTPQIEQLEKNLTELIKEELNKINDKLDKAKSK